MAERRSWLESRHLQRNERGRAALALIEDLGAAPRTQILERGDALAEISAGLAHGYFAAAVAIAGNAPQSFVEWDACGQRLLQADGGRSLAQCFFELDAVAFMAAPREARDAWSAAVLHIHERSRRLASAFAQTCGRALCLDPTPSAHVLSTWADAVVDTAASQQWRGEFLAGRLIGSAEQLLTVLDPRAVPLWADVFAAIGTAGRNPKCPAVPPGLEDLDGELQHRVLALCAALLERGDSSGARLLAVLPRAAAALGQSAATVLTRAVELARGDRGLADAVEMVPALCHAINRPALELLLSPLRDVAERFPAGVVPYLRTMDRAWEEGGAKGVALWVERGIEIGRRNGDAGVAHFRLESRTSHKLLVQHSTAVTLEEVEQVLVRFALMVARRPMRLVGGQGIWFRPPLAAPQDSIVRLPERVDLCPTAEENQLFYKLTVAHAAGRWEYGTYGFRLCEYQARGHRLPDETPQGQDIVAFLDSFPNPLLASAMFVLLDGVRIDAALEGDFCGLAPDLERLGRFYAKHPPPTAPERTGERLIEAVFLASVGRLPAAQLPARLRAYRAVVASIIGHLRRREATVYDSVDLLVGCYATLELAAVRGIADDDDAVIVDLGGATVTDPLDYVGDDSAPGPALPPLSSAAAPPIDVDGEVAEHEITLAIEAGTDDDPADGIPLTPDEIRRLIEQGVDLRISEGHGQDAPSLGLYITDLLGKLPADEIQRLREMVSAGDSSGVRAWLTTQRGRKFYYYDEWDHRIGDYLHRWCRLSEHEVQSDGGSYYNRVLSRSGDLLQNVRREFVLMRPEQFRKVRGMEDGEDFDLAALVDAHADRKQRKTPSERVYIARRREERDVATLFLVDMSASTDEPLAEQDSEGRRIIDVIKDTLVILSAVLDEIGDAYAVYGFSGHGRDNVEYYQVKSFGEGLTSEVRGRLAGIEPKRSTRMGAALRHSQVKLTNVSARARHIILLSDGFPQDFDYGEDRRSNVHGIRDTMVALQEAENQGIKTFCITVDPGGHDYLGEMCARSRYAVIDDVEMLPAELPRIYRTVTRS